MIKKSATLAILLALPLFALNAQIAVRLGVDLEGSARELRTELAGTITEGPQDADAYMDAHPGFTAAVEYRIELERFFILGPGLQVQFPRSFQAGIGAPNPSATYIPAYLYIRMPLEVEGVTMGPVARLGYGLFLTNDTYRATMGAGADSSGPGLYWAAGLTMGLGNQLFADVVYAQNLGTLRIDATDSTRTERYHAVEVSLGYSL